MVQRLYSDTLELDRFARAVPTADRVQNDRKSEQKERQTKIEGR